MSRAVAINHVGESSHLKMVRDLAPIMTSDTTPSGEAFASSYRPYYWDDTANRPFRAFNKRYDSAWRSGNTGYINSYVGYRFTEQVTVRRIDVQHCTDGDCNCKDFILQGSNDDITWVDIQNCTMRKDKVAYKQSFIIKEPRTFLMYRILIKSVYDKWNFKGYVGIAQLRFYDKIEYTPADLADHNDVYYRWSDGGDDCMDFFTKMYIWNDTCDGLIWEKKCQSNDYILLLRGGGWLIHPNERYITGFGHANHNDPTNDLLQNKSAAVCKDYIVNTFKNYFYTSKNGKEWVQTRSDDHFVSIYGTNYTISANPNTNSGIFKYAGSYGSSANNSKLCGFTIQSDGHVTYKNLTPPSGAVEHLFSGGYWFFTYEGAGVGDPVYHMDPDGNIRATQLQIGDYSHSRYHELQVDIMDRKLTLTDKSLHRGEYGVPDSWNIWAAQSTDGYLTMRRWSFEHFPHYGYTNWGYQYLYYYDKTYRMIVPRYAERTQAWVYDVWYYGSDLGNSPIIIGDGAQFETGCPTAKWCQAIGWRVDYTNFHNKLDANKGAMVDARARTTYWTINDHACAIYFKDGKATDPYGCIVHDGNWAPYSNVAFNTLIYGDICDGLLGKSEKYPPYMWYNYLYRSHMHVYDHSNRTWNIPW